MATIQKGFKFKAREMNQTKNYSPPAFHSSGGIYSEMDQ
jgi:hypothetical protein